MSRQIFKSTALVSFITLISRVLGFVRDMLIARIFGADAGTDAFIVAFKIPNFFRRLFAEGAFAHAFVPALSRIAATDDRQALGVFIDRAAGTLALLSVAATALGVLAAPVLVMLFAPGLSAAGEPFDLSVRMLRITMPYVFFVVSVAFAGSLLNARGRFAVPAFTPVWLNVCMIVAAVWVSPLLPEPITALAWGVACAGVLQLLFQFPALRYLGLVPRLRLGFHDQEVMRTLKLMGAGVFAVSVTQINLLLDTFMASWLREGSMSWLYYSERLTEFPLGLLGVALATVILPRLAEDHTAGDGAIFSRTLDFGLRLVLVLGLPAMTGLLMLAEPVLYTLFQYGEFTPADVDLSAGSLRGYALGLLGFMLIKVLATGFSARKDFSTPVRFGIYALSVNLLLNAVLIIPLAHVGLALATSLAAFANAGLLLSKLLNDRIYRPERGWFSFVGRIVLAVMVMTVVLGLFAEPTSPVWRTGSFSHRATQLLSAIVLGMVVYSGMLLSTGLRFRHLSGSESGRH